MIDRIGSLHLHYRIGKGGSLAPAVSASVDRAVHSGLGEALNRRMTALLGDDKAVIVVREIKSSVALGQADWTLDSRVVECISRACADAVLALLAGDPPADAVMRFEDQAAFTGSFIVALLEGSAWERWYYGAFHRYRRADPAATLHALLEESGDEVTALFGWLARHGHLHALLTQVTPREARRLLGAARLPDLAGRADGSAVLVDAAKRLLALLAPPPVHLAELDSRIAEYLAARPLAPDWTSAGSLSVWVMQLLRFVLRLPDGALPLPEHLPVRALRALLAGPLDWLDGRWLEAQLLGAADPPAEPGQVPSPRRQLLTPRQERVLGMLARSLASGELQLAPTDGEDDIVVRLIAAAAGAGGDGPIERGIIAVIERAAQAFVAAHGGRPDGPASVAASHAGKAPPPAQARDIDALRAAGPSAVALLDAMLVASGQGGEAGEASAAAGIFLLTRAVSDLRLPALARQAGVPLAPLLAALAAQWSGADLPAGQAMALWCGAELADPASLDGAGAALDALNDALLDLLVARRVMDDATAHEVIAADAASLDHPLPCDPHIRRRLAATACILLRGWAHWLPGVAGSGPLFLLHRCVRRAGSVCLSGERIVVELDPAPLDVVLQMAGYLAPIEQVAWMGGRSIVFTLRERASEARP